MHSNHDLDRLSTSLVYCLYRGSPGVKFGMHRKKGYVFTPRLKMCSASDSQPLPRTTSAWEQPLPQASASDSQPLPQTTSAWEQPLPQTNLFLRPLPQTHNLCLRPPSALDQPLPQASVPHSDQTLPQTNLCLRTDSASDHQLLAVGRWFFFLFHYLSWIDIPGWGSSCLPAVTYTQWDVTYTSVVQHMWL